MRKIFTYIAVISAFLAVSCNQVELSAPSAEDGLGTFTLNLDAGQMLTKAGDDPEAKITHFDYFFFSDAEGTDLLVSGSAEGTSKTFDTTSDAYKKINRTSYVYVLANYPDDIPEGTNTLAALLALPVKVGITALPAAGFVMDSYDSASDGVLVKLSPTKDHDVKSFTINMRRVAAKFLVDITVANSVTSGGLNWKATTDTKDFYIYMVNALDTAVVAGTPLTGSTIDDSYFHTYGHRHADMTGSGLSWTSAVTYAYPESFETSDQKAPYFKLQIPWSNVDEDGNLLDNGMHLFYYKVLLPNITEITRNTFYKLNLTIDKLGGTPEDYVEVTTDLMVSKWLSPTGDFTGYYSSRFLDIARDTFYVYGQDEIEVPVTSSHPIAVVTSSGSKYDFKNRKTVQVSDYTITPNGKSTFKLSKTLNNEITSDGFDCSPITYLVEIKHEDNKQPHTEKVVIIQYPPIYIEEHTSNGSVFVNGQSYSSNRGNRPNGQNNSYYVYNNDTNYWGTPNTSYGDDIGSIVNPTSVTNGSGDNNNTSQYNVFVSVLPSSNPNAIGDARTGGASIANLGFSRYSTTQNQRQVDNTVSANYRAAGQDVASVIAPAFKIASSYGKTTQMGFQRARERCASYQENGYPAGRWRLPTAAEVDFIVNLAQQKHIPSLFQPHINNGYWCSNGGIYSTSEGGDLIITESTSGTRSVRCVYDVWYWGDKQDSSHMTTWGGYQMD